MNKKTLTLLLLASITLLSVAGVKVSKLTRTTSFASNDLFIVVTGSTTKVTRHIRAQDLAVGLGPWITNSGSGTGGSATNAQPPSAVLTNLSITGAITNINAITLHSNAVSYASRLGLTNRQAISDISGFFWTLQNEGMLSAFHDAAFLRGGQNTETNITKRETWRGSNAVAWASPVQTANGILTGSGGGGYDFPTEDLSADFTLFFSGQSGAAGQSAGSKMISYTHTLGGTNFGISIGAETPNIKLVVRTNGYAAYANNFFGHLFTDYLMDDYPFPFTAGFGYNVSNNALTNWHNGYLSTNSTGPYQTGLKVISVGGQNDISTTNYVGFWKGTAHGWVLFNRQLASNEVKQLEVALRWLAPGTHNNIAVGDSTSANIYTKQSESWPYQFMIGPGTNTGEHYIAAASGRTAVSMNSLWADTATRRKPQGKVKTATARIWAGINDLYTSQTGQATWEAISNMTWKAGQDGIDVEVGTLYPSVVYDASMKVQWTNLNNQIISNAWMFKKVYRRDLMFAKTNGVMWYDFLHLSTNGLAEVVKDMSLGGQLGWKSVLPYYPVGASAGQVLTSDADGNATWGASSSGGSLATNANQFGASLTLTIKDGALLTNTSIRTALTLPTLTVSRAALVNSSGQITNSAAVSDVELEYLDGVTSLIQGQLDTKPSTTVLNTASNAIVALSSIGVTNYMLLNADRMIITNTLDRIEWSMGVNTNGVIPWGATNTIVYTPSNTFTITMSGTPPSGLARELNVLLINTNSTAGYFPTNDLNGGTIYMLPAPSTNRYKFNWRGGRFWISSGQQSETGTNSYMRTRTGVYRTIEVPAPAYSTNATNWSATFVSGGTNQGLGPKDFWLFSETATNEIHFGFSLPLTWDASALVARFLFATTNTIAAQTNVFSISARTVTGADYDGGTYGTAQIIKTKTTTGKEITWTTATPNLTPSGTPAAGAFTEFKVTRIPGHADDNMQGLLRLYSVQLQYKESIVEPTALP